MMNLLEINKRLKQRPPFQMIERVTEWEENKSATGIKCVSVNEPHFNGHFPDAPIMPGVLLIESAAQLCSLVISPDSAADDDKLYVLLKVKDFKFVRPVIPGDRLEIKVALSYLRMLVSADDLAFKRVINTPKRNMGERRIKFLEEISEKNHITLYNALKENSDNPIFKGTKAAEFLELCDKLSENLEKKSISELFTQVLQLSGYEEALRTEGAQERLDNLAELKQSIYEYEVTCGEETNLDSYLKHIALYTNSDLEDTKDRVKLMTVHAAKGLEFKNVFICGLNEGIFPSKKTRTHAAMEEERRLAFVAITRAKDSLYLTEAMGRNFDSSPRFPSRFLFDIGRECLVYINEPAESLIKEAKEYIKLYDKTLIKDKEDLLSEGSRIKHMILGEGTIVSIDSKMQAYVIKFDSSETERLISFKVSLDVI